MRGVLHLENYSASLDLTGCLKIICKKWEENEELFDSFTERPCTAYWSTPSVSVTGSGRPRFNISKQQLEYLCSLSFKWNGIAILLGVSRINLSKMHYGFLNAAHLMFSNNSEHTDIEYCNFSIIYLVKCKINCLHHTVFPLPQLTD